MEEALTSDPPDSAVFPTSEEVRRALAELTHAEIVALAARSGAKVPTLWRIRSGATPNPGIETVREFWPHIASCKRADV